MARELDVYIHQQMAGHLIQDDHGQMTYEYSESWLNNPNAIALSYSLPLKNEPYTRKECRGYFAGILPEEDKRKTIAKNLGISANNDFAMLEQIGGECAGAVTFIPKGECLTERNDRYRHLTNEELARILENLPRRPLMAGEDYIRLSLAGAQDKIAVYISNDQISIPLNGAASTHILKPAIEHFEGTVFNEAFCMKLSQDVGLSTAKTTLGNVEGIDYLLVERYDRVLTQSSPTNEMYLERLHQEDFCQALGIVSENKYQNEGGPSLQKCFDLVREASSIPVIDIQSLIDMVIFNFLIGNNDAHGKNFSLLYQGAVQPGLEISLAPSYDLLSTIYYPELTKKMAMKIGGEYVSDKVHARNFEGLAEEARLGKPMVKRRLRELAEKIILKIPDVMIEHSVAIGVAQIIQKRCEHILTELRT